MLQFTISISGSIWVRLALLAIISGMFVGRVQRCKPRHRTAKSPVASLAEWLRQELAQVFELKSI